jgi:hypothetical protein
MAKYDFEVKVCMGITCYGGGVYQEGDGEVELSNEEVAQLVALMQQHNSSDIEKIGLEKALPEIYNKLKDAYEKAASRANALHWLGNIWDFEDEEEFDKLIKYCEDNHHYFFEMLEEDGWEIDEDEDEDEAYEEAKKEDFKRWLPDYLSTAPFGVMHTIYLDYLGFDSEVFCVDEDAYKVGIPEDIVKSAKLTEKR